MSARHRHARPENERASRLSHSLGRGQPYGPLGMFTFRPLICRVSCVIEHGTGGSARGPGASMRANPAKHARSAVAAADRAPRGFGRASPGFWRQKAPIFGKTAAETGSLDCGGHPGQTFLRHFLTIHGLTA